MPEGSVKKNLLIYGASGHAKVIIDAVIKEGKYVITGVVDDNPELWKSEFCGYSVIGGRSILEDAAYSDNRLILAVGDNVARMILWKRLKETGHELTHVIHPSAQLGMNVSVGIGTVIMANVAINSGADIEENAIINTGATIDHDCVIGSYVHISPGVHLAGNVSVGELTHIGIGASVIQGIKIGRNVIIGAGAVVVDDTPDNVVVVGIPAKVIRNHEEV